MVRKKQIYYASASLALLGMAAIATWRLTADSSALSLLLLLSGLGSIMLAVLMYFSSPSRYLRADVSGAMALSDILSMNKVLSSLLVTAKGIHVPAAQAGALKLFLPLSPEMDLTRLSQLRPGEAVFEVSGDVKGIVLYPAGRGLFTYAQSIGASFTEDGLENEIRDVMENGLELADKVMVIRKGGRVSVTIRGLASPGLCAAIRKEDTAICARTSCPVCSFIACMIAEGTNKNIRTESVDVAGETVRIAYEII